MLLKVFPIFKPRGQRHSPSSISGKGNVPLLEQLYAAKEGACCGLIHRDTALMGNWFGVFFRFNLSSRIRVVVLVQVTGCRGIANSNVVMVNDCEQNRASGA